MQCDLTYIQEPNFQFPNSVLPEVHNTSKKKQ